MPANVTHLLIAHKALQTLKAKGIDEFAAGRTRESGDADIAAMKTRRCRI
jgi:hypothetical protein